MAITQKQLQNWYDKEHLVLEAEAIAESDDLTRTGRKLRKLKETFAAIEPVTEAMDRVLSERLFHAQQHFLNRRSQDMLRGKKDLDALKMYQIQQAQKTVQLLQESLDEAGVLFAAITNSQPNLGSDDLVEKLKQQNREITQNLRRTEETIQTIIVHGPLSACNLPEPPPT
ncbi:MAG: hypothetical protein HQL07_08620 [Nitrospirae bacterium]|nr:hypothetical protein [Magnetococcales bacterium]